MPCIRGDNFLSNNWKVIVTTFSCSPSKVTCSSSICLLTHSKVSRQSAWLVMEASSAEHWITRICSRLTPGTISFVTRVKSSWFSKDNSYMNQKRFMRKIRRKYIRYHKLYWWKFFRYYCLLRSYKKEFFSFILCTYFSM